MNEALRLLLRGDYKRLVLCPHVTFAHDVHDATFDILKTLLIDEKLSFTMRYNELRDEWELKLI